MPSRLEVEDLLASPEIISEELWSSSGENRIALETRSSRQRRLSSYGFGFFREVTVAYEVNLGDGLWQRCIEFAIRQEEESGKREEIMTIYAPAPGDPCLHELKYVSRIVISRSKAMPQGHNGETLTERGFITLSQCPHIERIDVKGIVEGRVGLALRIFESESRGESIPSDFSHFGPLAVLGNIGETFPAG